MADAEVSFLCIFDFVVTWSSSIEGPGGEMGYVAMHSQFFGFKLLYFSIELYPIRITIHICSRSKHTPASLGQSLNGWAMLDMLLVCLGAPKDLIK